MERESYVYRRPKRDLTLKQDKTAKEQATELLDELKKGQNSGDFELLFVDETTLSLNYPIYNCWMKRGPQKTIPAFSGKREYLHIIGAYNWRTDQVTSLEVERKNSEAFVAFLEELLVKTYSNHAVILVMDNASYHYSRAMRALLSLFAYRVRVFWLPSTARNSMRLNGFGVI